MRLLCAVNTYRQYTENISAPSQDSGKLTVVIMGWWHREGQGERGRNRDQMKGRKLDRQERRKKGGEGDRVKGRLEIKRRVGKAEGGMFRIEGTYVYLWPVRTDVWKKPSQYHNYPLIKINFKKF